MKNIKGPAIFLAQFVGDEAPFDSFDGICGWAASLGYRGVQIAAWDGRLIDLKQAAESQTYCDDDMPAHAVANPSSGELGKAGGNGQSGEEKSGLQVAQPQVFFNQGQQGNQQTVTQVMAEVSVSK